MISQSSSSTTKDYGQPVQHEETSCGLLLFRRCPSNQLLRDDDATNTSSIQYEFLLMKHSHRLDLPKGRMEPGETYLQTAKREFSEETGLDLNIIKIHPDFEFVECYSYFSHRKKCQVGKTLRMYLAFVKEDVASRALKVKPTEHGDFKWHAFEETKEISIQKNTIDPLLRAVQQYLKDHLCGMKDLNEQSL
ncbi:hypothetical protein C9374_007448 [Naegleria lovaniensis]|uniref:Bis(5'-nucleosyl)-tetraphosphatase [asymmetrical] n=1 Tax=Naegleria lovaniensis TaxID=51637 RepID=A0AA88GKR7_NAELO|nr:uncharacterized protein C9374_007448 [Naegleria lovaniensis]KAG2379309.1 hypothetical protein C9374_007448 [Naegleria lovaniensis]